MAGRDQATQLGPAQPADKLLNEPMNPPAGCASSNPHNQENATTVPEIQAAIRAATGADVPPGDIHDILAEYSPEAIMEKVLLIGDMGRQELRNVPGLLIHLLKDDSRHIGGRAQGKTRAASNRYPIYRYDRHHGIELTVMQGGPGVKHRGSFLLASITRNKGGITS